MTVTSWRPPSPPRPTPSSRSTFALPLDTLAAVDLTVHTPGELIDLVLGTDPDLVVAAVEHMRARWANPPRTEREIVELLARHPTLAEPAERLERMLSRTPPASLLETQVETYWFQNRRDHQCMRRL